MSKKQIPNPNGDPVKVGDKVKINEGEWIGYIGEIVTFVHDGEQWIKEVRTINLDGKVTLIEVKDVVVSLVPILSRIGQSKVFKRFWGWLTGLFRKKKKRK